MNVNITIKKMINEKKGRQKMINVLNLNDKVKRKSQKHLFLVQITFYELIFQKANWLIKIIEDRP